MFPTVFPLDCFSGKISKPRIHTRLAPASSGRLRWSAISPEPALCRLCCEPPPHAQIALALRMRFQHRSVRHPGSRRCSCACCAFRAAVAHGMNAGILRVAHASHAAHRYHGTLVPAMMAATGWQQSIRSGMTAPRSHHLTQRRGIRTGRQQHSQDECNSSLSKPFHLLRVISCLHIWHKPFRGSVCLFHFARPRPSRAPLVFVADKARGCCMQCHLSWRESFYIEGFHRGFIVSFAAVFSIAHWTHRLRHRRKLCCAHPCRVRARWSCAHHDRQPQRRSQAG